MDGRPYCGLRKSGGLLGYAVENYLDAVLLSRSDIPIISPGLAPQGVNPG